MPFDVLCWSPPKSQKSGNLWTHPLHHEYDIMPSSGGTLNHHKERATSLLILDCTAKLINSLYWLSKVLNSKKQPLK